MKRAFTLIELLVVIAIIAILAAILFPVFAQAKAAAKKAAALSNTKQIATSSAIYLSDSDDCFPLQSGMSQSGQWGYNFNKYVPADWSSNPSNPDRIAYSQGFFMNTIFPYTKNYDIEADPGATGTEYMPTEAIVAGKKKYRTSYAYNGLLTSLSSTAVASPAKCPLLTQYNGVDSGLGWGFANPALNCDVKFVACVYIPSSSTCSASTNGSTSGTYGSRNASSMYIWNKGQNWAFTDGHSKYRRVGSSKDTDADLDEFTGYDTTTGVAGFVWGDGCHSWLFRPDYENPK